MCILKTWVAAKPPRIWRRC